MTPVRSIRGLLRRRPGGPRRLAISLTAGAVIAATAVSVVASLAIDPPAFASSPTGCDYVDTLIATGAAKAIYRMNDTGTAIADSSGAGANATAANSSFRNSPAPVCGPIGAANGALGFNGSSTKVTAPSALTNVAYSQMTVMTWFKANAFSGNQRLVSNAHTDVTTTSEGGGSGFQVRLNGNGGTGNFDVGTKSGSKGSTTGWTQALATGQWYFFAGTYNGSNGLIKAYINGVPVSSATANPTGNMLAVNLPVTFGVGTYGTDWFNGQLAGGAILNTALSDTAIATLYNQTPAATIGTSTTPLGGVASAATWTSSVATCTGAATNTWPRSTPPNSAGQTPVAAIGSVALAGAGGGGGAVTTGQNSPDAKAGGPGGSVSGSFDWTVGSSVAANLGCGGSGGASVGGTNGSSCRPATSFPNGSGYVNGGTGGDGFVNGGRGADVACDNGATNATRLSSGGGGGGASAFGIATTTAPYAPATLLAVAGGGGGGGSQAEVGNGGVPGAGGAGYLSGSQVAFGGGQFVSGASSGPDGPSATPSGIGSGGNTTSNLSVAAGDGVNLGGDVYACGGGGGGGGGYFTGVGTKGGSGWGGQSYCAKAGSLNGMGGGGGSSWASLLSPTFAAGNNAGAGPSCGSAACAKPGLAGGPGTVSLNWTSFYNYKLSFTTAAAGCVSGGVCTTQPKVTVQDSSGATVAGSIQTITLSAPGWTSTGCTAQASGGVATFTACGFTGPAGPQTVTATAWGSITPATSSTTLGAGTASVLAITSAPINGPTSPNATLGPITVERRDSAGNPASPASATTVNLATSSAGGVFSATAGGANTTTVTIPSGASTASFYYGDTVVGTPMITASGLTTNGTQTATIVIRPGKLVFTSSPVTGAASATTSLGPITLQRQDNTGVPLTAGDVVISLSSNSTGAKAFSLTASGAAIGTVTIPNGSSSVSFFYGDTKAGTPTITATGLATPGTQTVTVVAAAPSKLVALTPSVTGAASATASVGPITVQRQDQFNNPASPASVTTVTPSSTSSGTVIFAGTLNGTGASTFDIPASSDRVTIYYGDTKAGAPTITAASGIGSPTIAATISPGAAAKLALLTAPVSQTAVATNFTVVAQIQDTWGNRTTATNSITMSGAGLAGTLTVAAVNGEATFSTLKVNQSTLQYKVTATMAGLPAVDSSLFDVVVFATKSTSVNITNGASDEAGGSGMKSVSYYACPGFSNATPCTAATPWTLVGTSSATSPYIVATAPATSGKYRYVAVATDNAGNVSTPSASTPVYVP